MQNRFTSKDDETKFNEERGKKRKESEQKRENRRAANKPYGVSMTGKIRRIVEGVVGRKGGVDGGANAAEVMSVPGKKGIYDYLVSPVTGGFTASQATVAARENGNIVDAICWLVRRLEEGELPGKWKPSDG
ncbi:hypothetical protein TrRE_jg11204, partial [Triparma retinervis]